MTEYSLDGKSFFLPVKYVKCQYCFPLFLYWKEEKCSISIDTRTGIESVRNECFIVFLGKFFRFQRKEMGMIYIFCMHFFPFLKKLQNKFI